MGVVNNKLIWALTDGRPGSDNQTIAVAARLVEKFGEKFNGYENRRIEFGPSGDLPNFLLGKSDLGIITKLEKPWPDLVISAGRRLARVTRMIKKDSPKTKAIQLMWPGIGAKDFDLIFAPEHDALKPRHNVIITDGPPNLMTQEVLKASAEKWQNRIPIDQKPVIAVLVGNITLEETHKLINMLNVIDGYFMISSSRRSPGEITKALATGMQQNHYFHKWTADNENPYLGFIALADYIIVTEDSVSMCSEAVTTGKPTYIYECKTIPRHQRFAASLINSGKARRFTGENLELYSYQPLHTLETIVSIISEKVVI